MIPKQSKKLINPNDLTSIPPEFFASQKYIDSLVLNDPNELRHYRTIIASFLNYKNDCENRIQKTVNSGSFLSESQKNLMKFPIEEKLNLLKKSIEENQSFFNKVVKNDLNLFENIVDFDISFSNQQKIRSVLIQIYREWSHEGAIERQQCYQPILEKLKELFPVSNGIQVLVPGCALGRLPYEIACLGFSVQGNEFAYEMILTSQLIFNDIAPVVKHSVYPRVHNWSNHRNFTDMFEKVEFPDIDVFKITDLSIAAGEFVEVYRTQNEVWDVVVTCFFIDTAPNILEYIETIHKILNPNGRWINLGPLTYHYSESTDDLSIELSLEELIYAVQKMGFKYEQLDSVFSQYCVSQKSLLKVGFDCSFFVCTKQ